MGEMKIIGVIPARYASTRFPGKPLFMIDGKAMIQRVYEQASKCSGLAEVIIATDHTAISNHARAFGGRVMMTSESHRSGTDRCGEVAQALMKNGTSFDAVINIQGDEPFLEPEQIEQVARCLAGGARIATLVKKIISHEELTDSNVVKVVTGLNGQALYFSRSAIPFYRGKDLENWPSVSSCYKHIGIYGYHRNTLIELISLPPAPLETAESLEQLRWLENGYEIMTRVTEFESIAIDVPADLLKITNRS
jgi:3-deoxy-manno-octulosonate cytidylyltransferase (CMP-KDO synthetase)